MRKTVGDHKKDLIERLTTARMVIITQITALAPNQKDEIYLGSWSIKDLLAHLAGWDVTNLQAVQEITAGQYPSFFQYYNKDWQRYNADLVQKYRAESFELLLSQAADSHQALISYLESLPAETVVHGKVKNPRGRTVTIRNLILSEAADEEKHSAEIAEYFQAHPLQLPA